MAEEQCLTTSGCAWVQYKPWSHKLHVWSCLGIDQACDEL